MKETYLLSVEPDQLESVAKRLRARSVDVTQVLDQIGIITVEVEARQVAALESLEGVVSVEKSRTVGPA